MAAITLPQPVGTPSTTWNDRQCVAYLAGQAGVTNVTASSDGYIVSGTPDPTLAATFAAFVAPPNTREQGRETREANLRTAVAIVRAYPQIASPSAAQRLAFERAIARVVGNLVRERLQEDGAD